MNWTAWFASLSATQIIVILLVAGIIALFVYFQWRGNNDYDFLDTLRDSNGKVSIGAHFAWGFFVLAVYLIVVEGGKDATAAWPWVRDALLISLGYRVATSGIAAMAKRPVAPAQPTQTVGQQNIITGGDDPGVEDEDRPLPGAARKMAARKAATEAATSAARKLSRHRGGG
jgi:hypothetical protein